MLTYIVTMETSIQVSKELLEKLKLMKLHEKESYENLIWDLIEDRMEFSKKTKKNIKEYEQAVKKGKTKFTKLEDVKEELKVNV